MIIPPAKKGKDVEIVRGPNIKPLPKGQALAGKITGEVLLKVEACCVCGSDRRTFRHGHAQIPPPRILGHEFCGTVVETRAPDHIDIKVGDRVVMYIVMPCGTCRPCKDGKVNICLTRKTMASHFDGAYAE